MVMNAPTFFAQLKQVKGYVQERPDASAELKAAVEKLGAAFKKAYTPEAFKAALSEGAAVDSELEERLTSAVILMNSERAKRSSG